MRQLHILFALFLLIVVFLILTIRMHYYTDLCINKSKDSVGLREQIRPKQRYRPPYSFRPELRRNGWTVDCITWNLKWEIQQNEPDMHEFTEDDNFKYKENRKISLQTTSQMDWLNQNNLSLHNSQRILAIVHNIIDKLKVHLGISVVSILDVGCYPLSWMQHLLVARDDIQYTCYEIYSATVLNLTKKYENLDHSSFLQHDVTVLHLNQSFDLIITRDLLKLLFPSDALQTLFHISSSGSQYILVTNYPDSTTNPSHPTFDIIKRPEFLFNLELPPFLFPPPICSTYDKETQHIALWELPLKQKYEY